MDYKHESPAYQVIETKEEYETRLYPQCKLAMVCSKGLPYNQSRGRNFSRLFRYIQGNNERKEQIAMTVPVINQINMTGDSKGNVDEREIPVEDEFSMGFFVPKNNFDNPPGGGCNEEVNIVDFG